MTDNGYIKPSFAIIKSRGDLNTCTTADGKTVHRQEKVWVEEDGGRKGRFVFCAPDSDHFVFIDPVWKKKKGRWFAICSCGAPSVIVGYNAYKDYGSPTTRLESTTPGELLVCYVYLLTGKHLDVNWMERDKNK